MGSRGIVIPDFDENGYLPPGIHRATLDEVIARFGHGSRERREQAESLEWLLPLCARAGIVRLILNGSYVTDELDPKDVDCVLLQGPAYEEASEAAFGVGRWPAVFVTPGGATDGV